MDPKHRDRVAFMRICSGEFDAGMEVNHIQGGRKVKLSQPTQMMADERKIVEKAYGVGVIGMVDNVLRPVLVGKNTKMPD